MYSVWKKLIKRVPEFDLDKIKWFNQQYLKSTNPKALAETVRTDLKNHYAIDSSLETALVIVDLLKERVTFPHEMAPNALFIFRNPTEYDQSVTSKKWNEEAEQAVSLYAEALATKESINAEEAKELFFSLMETHGIKAGKNMQALRMVITGAGSGPDLMAIIALMGGKAVAERIKYSVDQLK